MEIDKVEKFAKNKGFDKVEYVGKYKNYEPYKPLHDTDRLIGWPFYILIVKNKPRLVTGDLGMKILKCLNR